MLINTDDLGWQVLYTMTGGEGWTIPFGLYECDGYGATYGKAIKPFSLEEHDKEVRENLLKTILQNQHTLIDEEGMEYLVVDVLDIEDVCDMYNFIDSDEFKDFLYGDEE